MLQWASNEQMAQICQPLQSPEIATVG